MNVLTIVDLLVTPVFISIILILSFLVKNKNIKSNPEYKYYIPGLSLKLFGGFAVCMIYTLYYSGGDTSNYFLDGVVMNRLLFKDPKAFFQIMAEGLTYENYYHLDEETGYASYVGDPQTFFVVKLTLWLVMVSFRSFVGTTILLAWISFVGMWRLYRVFVYEFPNLKKELAIAVFFLPSVFFWGSGLLKDTITLSCVGYFTHAFYMIFVRRKRIAFSILTLLLSSYIILSIKPYIIFALLLGSLTWVVNGIIRRTKGGMVKMAVAPTILFISFMAGYALLASLETSLGYYKLSTVLERAVVVQQDLQAKHYEGSTFDIGEFEATVPSVLSKAPAAIMASLFRPYIWEARNPVMIAAALENLYIAILTLIVLFRVRVFGILKYAFKNELLTFCLIFSMFFAFAVGLSTSNFGSLVRYKIPLMPFYVAALFIVSELRRQQKDRTISKSPELQMKPIS